MAGRPTDAGSVAAFIVIHGSHRILPDCMQHGYKVYVGYLRCFSKVANASGRIDRGKPLFGAEAAGVA